MYVQVQVSVASYQLKHEAREVINHQTSEPHFHQDQDQDSLLIKRRNDNHSPGPVIRELVPSSLQRSEFSNKILCVFSR